MNSVLTAYHQMNELLIAGATQAALKRYGLVHALHEFCLADDLAGGDHLMGSEKTKLCSYATLHCSAQNRQQIGQRLHVDGSEKRYFQLGPTERRQDTTFMLHWPGKIWSSLLRSIYTVQIV